MQGGRAALLATIVVLVLFVIAAYGWYHFTGWQPFGNQTGDSVSWLPPGGADISRLRFKDCVFVVTRGDGKTATQDVTAVLNGMAAAYSGGISNPPTLKLARPLNPFSFVIAGFNDRATVPDPSAAPWCSSPPAACKTDADCPSPVPGACGAGGTCYSCPGGAAVTLAGKWRAI